MHLIVKRFGREFAETPVAVYDIVKDIRTLDRTTAIVRMRDGSMIRLVGLRYQPSLSGSPGLPRFYVCTLSRTGYVENV